MDAKDKEIMEAMLLRAKKELEEKGKIQGKVVFISAQDAVVEMEVPEFMMVGIRKTILANVIRVHAELLKPAAFFFIMNMLMKVVHVKDYERLKNMQNMSIKDVPGVIEAILLAYETETVQETWIVEYRRGIKIEYKDPIVINSAAGDGALGRFANILYKGKHNPPF